jgi:hypothetical protein
MKLQTNLPSTIASMIVVSLSFLIAFGCNKNDKSALFHLPEKIEMPRNLNLTNNFKNETGTRMSGNLTIYQFEKGEILLSFTDNINKEYIRSYILQTNGSLSKSVKKINNAEIIFLKDLLLVNNIDANMLTCYKVKTDDYKAIYNAIPATVREKISETTVGFGLSITKGTWEMINENISLNGSLFTKLKNENSSNTESGDGGGALSCAAGGPGSTSCSVSGCAGTPSECTVSCAAGYFGCCYCTMISKNASCHCISNSSGGD